ncbi:hypothetical protein DUI87_25888 [Hirundo rustica rustica]|uniref:Uncharacterized protein n=1 Tax=Hirundo rustica rustica TaxID=333673 RepID=A0A3M0JS02_HIRRU|nr:hypothetical protein DUI87_25888 [Hirundo rustica rustica]
MVVKQMKDFLWGTTKVTPESSLGQEVGKFIGYCREAGTVKQVQSSGTELPLHCSKPVYCGVVTQENAPADDWEASTSSRPELQWGPRGPYDDREANEGNFRQTLTALNRLPGKGDSSRALGAPAAFGHRCQAQAGIVGVSCAWPGVGLQDPDGSLPTPPILCFWDPMALGMGLPMVAMAMGSGSRPELVSMEPPLAWDLHGAAKGPTIATGAGDGCHV